MHLPRPLRSRTLTTLGATLALLLAAAGQAATGAGTVGDLYVTSDASNVVRAYNGASGVYLGNHCSSVAPATGELAVHFGLSNGRMLVGHFGGGVNEFDAATGAYIKTYNPGGGWMWSAVYAPNGNVYVASSATDEIIEYDANTAAFVRVVQNIPGNPSDMRFGPNGHLYVCTYGTGMVFELLPIAGTIVSAWSLPPFDQANDVAFLPSGEILVTAMTSNVVYRYSNPAHVLLGSFAGTGWMRPHGIDIRPSDGHIFVADGVTTQVHEFDPVTFAEINANWRVPGTGDKIVDIEFRRDNRVVSTTNTSWGRLKALYR